MPYGWLIKHQLSGAYGVVNTAPDGLSVTVIGDPEEATLFPSRKQAVDTILFLHNESSTFPDCDVVDYSTRPELIPDADAAPVPTRAEVIAAAREAGTERRAAHAAARVAHREKPSARLIEKPSNQKAN